MEFQQGQVCSALISPGRGNPKLRPVILVTPTPEIAAGEPIVAIAVSTTFTEPLSPDQIELPWERNGRCITGLSKRSVAVCTWLMKIRASDIREIRGCVPPRALRRILERIRAAESEPKGTS